MEEVAQQPRWSAERVEQLEGQCAGALLGHWADNVRHRWGKAAVADIRDALGPSSDVLPDHPQDGTWIPAHLQIRLTDIIIDRYLDGDALALEDMLHEDSMRHGGEQLRAIIRRMGPQVLLRLSKRIHSRFYSVGIAQAKVGWGKATLRTYGAPLFANPTWRLLHLYGLRGMMTLAERDCSILITAQQSDGIEVQLRW